MFKSEFHERVEWRCWTSDFDCSPPSGLLNLSLQSGTEMKLRGVARSNPVRFTIDIGHSEDTLALHFDFRFNYGGVQNIIVLNSRHNGDWREEQREDLPFRGGQEFQVTIRFTADKFYINLHQGKTIEFPNRLGDSHYKFFRMRGDCEITSIQMK